MFGLVALLASHSGCGGVTGPGEGGGVGGSLPAAESALEATFRALNDALGRQGGWVRRVDREGYDLPTGVVVSNRGVSYLAGVASVPMLLDGLDRGDELYLRAYDASGSLLFDAPTLTVASGQQAPCRGGSEDLYVAGDSRGAPSLAGGAYLARYSELGVPAWRLEYGVDEQTSGRGCLQDGAGNLFIAGAAGIGSPGDLEAVDAYLMKVSEAGVVAWTVQFGSERYDSASPGLVDREGNVYVGGYTDGALSSEPSAGLADAFVAKYSTEGTRLWLRQFGGVGTDGAGGDMTWAADGSLRVRGATNSSFDGGNPQVLDESFVANVDPEGRVNAYVQVHVGDRNRALLRLASDGTMYAIEDSAAPGPTGAIGRSQLAHLNGDGSEISTFDVAPGSGFFVRYLSVEDDGTLYAAGTTDDGPDWSGVAFLMKYVR